MNLLKAKHINDAQNIVSVMKQSLEGRQGKKWSLNSDQSLWLKNQIMAQINSSMQRSETPDKIVLA